MFTCLFCKTDFTPKRTNKAKPQKYCCYQCSSNDKTPKKYFCVQCKTETKNPKFCSRSCSAIYNNTGKIKSLQTKEKIKTSVINKLNSLSFLEKESIKKKRVDARRKKFQAVQYNCVACGCNISKFNKHKMCQKCYFSSDAAVKAWGHFSKSYNRGYVFSPYANRSIYLLSGYEIGYAKWLNENNIAWDKPKPIPYKLNGKDKNYYPDFLLVNTNEIIEIKGYWWNNDRLKMDAVRSQHPELKITVLTNKELKILGVKSIRADTSL